MMRWERRYARAVSVMKCINSNDFTQHSSICHETECVSNHLYSDSVNAHNEYTQSEFYNDFGAYTAIRYAYLQNSLKHAMILCVIEIYEF